ncbi:major facilitator superfamily domain-containing protein 6-like [Clytia hemisphaerica]|uniref:Major facilitator superfamily associated domain-containing protein n=1 Tax=Clytia hemisphaerica TaxID=252671 RepID=A0A7M5ULS8_9CNID
MAWYNISRSMIPCKLAYFLLIAKEFAIRMNLVLFLLSIGLSKSQAGLIVGLRLVSVIGFSPFIGMISDKYRIHRLTIVLCSVIVFIFNAMQPVLALKFGSKTFLYCSAGSEENRNSTTTSNLNTTSPFSTESPTSTSPPDQQVLFWVMIAVNLIQSLFDGSLDAFIDTGVMLRIKQSNENGEKNKYGPQRIFGVLGHMVGPILGNYSIALFPSDHVTCYTGVFILYGFLSVCYMLTLLWVFHGLKMDVHDLKESEEEAPLEEKGEKEKLEQQPFRTVLFRTLLEEEMLVMVLTLFGIGCLMSEIVYYSFPYLKDLNATTMDLNLYLIIYTVGNFIGFLIIPKLVRLVKGSFPTIFILLIVLVLRFSLVAAFNDPKLISVVQILSMFDYPITETVGLEFVLRKSPKRVLTSMYGIINAVQYSLPECVGNTLGGYIYEKFGAKVLFYGCSVVAATLSLALVLWIVKKQIQETKQVREKNGQELTLVEKS